MDDLFVEIKAKNIARLYERLAIIANGGMDAHTLQFIVNQIEIEIEAIKPLLDKKILLISTSSN